MKLEEITNRQRSIRDELKRLQDDPNVTEEDHADLRDSLIAEYEKLDKRAQPIIERMEKMQLIERAAKDSENRERAVSTDPAPSDRTTATGRGGPDVHTRTYRDPFDAMDKVRARMVPSSEIRSRAVDAVEQSHRRDGLPHDLAETATLRAQSMPGVARHILETGSPEYRDAFAAYMSDPEGAGRQRAALSLTAANGGYLLPYVLDPTIVLTNTASTNPFRRVGNIKQTTSNAWQGVTSAGVNAAWVAEAGTAADNSPTVGQIQITPEKAVAWVMGSYEVLDDTDFGAQLPRLLSDARDRLESDAFATGAGSGSNLPLGVLPAVSGTAQSVNAIAGTGASPVGTGTAAFPQVGDVYNLQAALPPRFRNSAKAGFMANIYWLNKVRALDTYGGGSFWANLGSDTPEQLLGKPVYEASSLLSATATGTGTAAATLLYGDWDQFLIVDRVGVSMLYEPLIKGTAGSIPTGQAGWYAFWRTSSGVSTAAAFRYLLIGTSA